MWGWNGIFSKKNKSGTNNKQNDNVVTGNNIYQPPDRETLDGLSGSSILINCCCWLLCSDFWRTKARPEKLSFAIICQWQIEISPRQLTINIKIIINWQQHQWTTTTAIGSVPHLFISLSLFEVRWISGCLLSRDWQRWSVHAKTTQQWNEV